MPLIRYRTGDLSRFIPGPCPCGSTLRTLEKINCRLDGQVPVHISQEKETASRPIFPMISMADLDEALFPLSQVLNFSARLTSQDGKDRLEIILNVLPKTKPEIASQALLALESIAAIQISRQAGFLEVDIATQEFGASRTSGLGKRMILDQRGKNDA